MKSKYGFGLDTYRQMVKDQNGQCKICKEVHNELLVVDHCHATSKIRGLLCSKCNKGIGLLKDKVEVLEAATKYLKDSK